MGAVNAGSADGRAELGRDGVKVQRVDFAVVVEVALAEVHSILVEARIVIRERMHEMSTFAASKYRGSSNAQL